MVSNISRGSCRRLSDGSAESAATWSYQLTKRELLRALPATILLPMENNKLVSELVAVCIRQKLCPKFLHCTAFATTFKSCAFFQVFGMFLVCLRVGRCTTARARILKASSYLYNFYHRGSLKSEPYSIGSPAPTLLPKTSRAGLSFNAALLAEAGWFIVLMYHRQYYDGTTPSFRENRLGTFSCVSSISVRVRPLYLWA